MTAGLQELLALAIVAIVVIAVVFRRLRAKRRSNSAKEASVSAEGIGRRQRSDEDPPA